MKPSVFTLSKLNLGKRIYAAFAICAITAIPLPAQTFTSLFSFDLTDGAGPSALLVQATNGDLYGTTPSGGPGNYGTIFKMTPRGTLTTLYNFCSKDDGCTDGYAPYGRLVQAANGDLYGTTFFAGANCTRGGSCGTVFKITLSGTFTTVYNFCSENGCADGDEPNAGLSQATNGDLYGTTVHGGANGLGTIFKIRPNGVLTTLYSFCSDGGQCADGELPYAGLVQATDGNFYGTTIEGGAHGFGTVFKITPAGTLTTLYTFCSSGGLCTDGAGPLAALIQAADGFLYGTTEYGGANGYYSGTVFKITPSGTLTTLHSFCPESDCADGQYPAGLTEAANGDFYGTTSAGGSNSTGTIFSITSSGNLATLYNFCSQSACADGGVPKAGLIQHTDGGFYGSTMTGGVNENGVLFRLSVGLSPFVQTQTSSAKVGQVVKILGTGLTGATSVSFHGTAAAFTVVSPSLIVTTVPAGATSGKIQVGLPSGALLSNEPFRVSP